MKRIVYLSWPAKEITGGIKMVFRHVEALRSLGFETLVATEDGAPPAWFATLAPVVPLTELRQGDDVLVFPENHAGLLKRFAAWPNRKVVFCQNPSMAFRGVGERNDYRDYGVSSVLCPAQNVATFCRRRFPALEIFVIPYPLDRMTFRPRLPKRLQIAYAPRKRPLEAAFVRDLFQAENPGCKPVPWVLIEKMSETEVARILGESAVYLALGRFEALGLSALEALASGCIVAGFTGTGGWDYATSRNGFWAVEDDLLGCTAQLTEAVRMASEDKQRYHEMCADAQAAAAVYSDERFLSRLLECWRRLAE
jgi:glycosyltransferase involved in cell wall biosynthesis